MRRTLRNFMKFVVNSVWLGKHPASLCLNKDGKNCHNCGGACQDGEFKKFPGYQYDFVGGDSKPAENNAASDAQLVAEITKQVMAQLGMK